MSADIGLIGLAVMGENLVLNFESKGFTVAVYNRTTETTDKFVNGRGKGKNIIGCHSVAVSEFSSYNLNCYVKLIFMRQIESNVLSFHC